MTNPIAYETSSPAPTTPLRGRRSPVLELTRLLARPRAQGGAAVVLPVVAFAVTTGLLLTVVGGTRMFAREAEQALAGYGSSYLSFSALALVLLAVPLFSLGAAAARLSARRRDDRLATLRLLGASARQVSAIAVVEATATAFIGALLGVLGHLVLMPFMGLLPFFGSRIGPTATWAGALGVLGGVVAVTALAALSAVAGLQRVRLTPLGVRSRAEVPVVPMRRAVIGVIVLGLGVGMVAMTGNVMAAFGVAAAGLMLLGVIAGGLALLNLIGPAILAARARAGLLRARTAVDLVAARQLLEDPKGAWRRVGAMSMVAFVGVVGGVGMTMTAGPSDGPDAIFVADLRTGVLLTLAIAFVMVACATGITEAAAILDRRDLVVALDRMGAPDALLEQVRMRTVMRPLLIAVLIGAVAGAALTFPLIGMAVLFAPTSVAVAAATFAIGFAMVALSVRATRPVTTAVRRTPERA